MTGPFEEIEAKGGFLELREPPRTTGNVTEWDVFDPATETRVGTVRQSGTGRMGWSISFEPELLEPSSKDEALDQMRQVWARYRAGKLAEDAARKP